MYRLVLTVPDFELMMVLRNEFETPQEAQEYQAREFADFPLEVLEEDKVQQTNYRVFFVPERV